MLEYQLVFMNIEAHYDHVILDNNGSVPLTPFLVGTHFHPDFTLQNFTRFWLLKFFWYRILVTARPSFL